MPARPFRCEPSPAGIERRTGIRAPEPVSLELSAWSPEDVPLHGRNTHDRTAGSSTSLAARPESLRAAARLDATTLAGPGPDGCPIAASTAPGREPSEPNTRNIAPTQNDTTVVPPTSRRGQPPRRLMVPRTNAGRPRVVADCNARPAPNPSEPSNAIILENQGEATGPVVAWRRHEQTGRAVARAAAGRQPTPRCGFHPATARLPSEPSKANSVIDQQDRATGAAGRTVSSTSEHHIASSRLTSHLSISGERQRISRQPGRARNRNICLASHRRRQDRAGVR